ncbi:MFS transporter [Parablautia intestinalis]|jgi:PPP family 3-phenylpropionic acid transporter|uniref:MFS transporter n=1 Tax=Parablautia intestinalis TaxID=2320100 RepID=A0A3A9AK28_9FIRM|nr:MFS transporter [Parablautia intestinalis]MCI8614757.1 MFS transporter [Lachnospiraceae bacterium]MDE7047515.1 MFS transporter [Lachnospiraceae bacterium]RKI91719.1 MFS transporter [Parablautia intestinalis]
MKYKRTIQYAFIQSGYWMGVGGLIGFSSAYLLENGYTNGQIGVIAAICSLISTFGQIVVAGWVDRSGGKQLKRWLYLITGSLLAASLLQAILFPITRLGASILFAVDMALLQMVLPLINSLSVGKEPEGGRTDFGIARGAGSLAYALLAAILGKWVARWGARSISLTICGIFLLLFLSVHFYAYEPRELSGQDVQRVSREKGFLFRYPRFGITLSGCILLYISHVLLNNFSLQIVLDKGWDSVVMGNTQAIAAVLELPVMFCFGYLLKKKPASFWFRLCGIAFFLKTVGTLLATSVGSFYAVQLMQMGGWAVIAVAPVYYIKGIMAPQDAVKGQSYFTMTNTIASVVGSFACGFLIDDFGMGGALLLGSICAAIGAVILLVSVQRTENHMYTK